MIEKEIYKSLTLDTIPDKEEKFFRRRKLKSFSCISNNLCLKFPYHNRYSSESSSDGFDLCALTCLKVLGNFWCKNIIFIDVSFYWFIICFFPMCFPNFLPKKAIELTIYIESV